MSVSRARKDKPSLPRVMRLLKTKEKKKEKHWQGTRINLISLLDDTFSEIKYRLMDRSVSALF